MLSDTKAGISTAGTMQAPSPKGMTTTLAPVGGTNGTSTTVSEARIQALEQRVQQLEAALNLITSALVVANNGQKVTLKGHKIEMEADTEVKIRGGVQVHISASADLTLKSSATAKLEGCGGVVVKSTGTTKVNGAKVILNEGNKGVARQSDAVLGANGVGAVIGGSGTVLA
jgi:hypothetical protein